MQINELRCLLRPYRESKVIICHLVSVQMCGGFWWDLVTWRNLAKIESNRIYFYSTEQTSAQPVVSAEMLCTQT